MDFHRLTKWIPQAFKLNGFSILPDAVDYLANQFESLTWKQRRSTLDEIFELLQKLNLKTIVVHKEHILKCSEVWLGKSDDSENVWNVINIFTIPQFSFCSERKKYLVNKPEGARDLFSDAEKKILMVKRRYNSLYQRTLRHDFFQQQKMLNAQEQQLYMLKTVEWFLCHTDRIENAVLVGLLVQKNETSYIIEDPTGSLQLDLSKAKFREGLYPEHCIVLVEGVYEEEIFYVKGIGFPPPEASAKSRFYFNNENVFGGPGQHDLSVCPNLAEIQKSKPSVAIVFISDVWLDKIEVLEKLEIVFSTLNSNPPLAFVLIGNFLLSPKDANSSQNLKSGLKSLGEIIAKHSSIRQKSRIVLVPGPFDLGSPHILPRPPIPDVLASDLKSLVPTVTLATNPCRIQYCNRRIVVFREDLISKICRNTVHFPASGDIQSHFAKTIISQGTLIPLSPNVCPVYWNYSHCFDVYPLPDLIVAADQFKPYSLTHVGCTVINPGTFMKSNFSFQLYRPHQNIVEDNVL